ncbi:MAG: hypothetical protein ACKO3M_09530 [Rubrivivax sp.]
MPDSVPTGMSLARGAAGVGVEVPTLCAADRLAFVGCRSQPDVLGQGRQCSVAAENTAK